MQYCKHIVVESAASSYGTVKNVLVDYFYLYEAKRENNLHKLGLKSFSLKTRKKCGK